MSATAPARHLFHWLAAKELRFFDVAGQLVPAAWTSGGHRLHGCAPAFRAGGFRGRPAIVGWRPRGGHARAQRAVPGTYRPEASWQPQDWPRYAAAARHEPRMVAHTMVP